MPKNPDSVAKALRLLGEKNNDAVATQLKEGIDIKLVRKEIVSIDKADKSDIVGLGYTDLKNVYKVYREADLNILRKKDYVEDCIPIISYRSGQAIEETSAQKSISVKKDLVERAIEGENLQEENE